MPPKPSKAEARAERRNIKKSDEEKKKIRLLARPDVAERPSPRVAVDPNNIFHQKMTWCITKGDVEGSWSWNEPRQWSDGEFQSHIKKTLDSLTGNTWAEIGQMIRDGLRMHHSQNVSTIHEEAQERWVHLGMLSDEAYRFSLTGRQRAWGFREGSHFWMVWYDRYHTLYVVAKSHT